MRKEPFTVGSYIHVIKRGSRGLPIVRDDLDRWRFLLMLKHFNDENVSESWFRDLMDDKISNTLNRSKKWLPQKKIVKILAFTLLDNHFHFLLKEIVEGGVSKFMQKLGTGMAKTYNEKYNERGSLFQGAYHSKTINEDMYLRYVSVYIQVKNAFDMFPGGQNAAKKDFDIAYEWAIKYPYCSLSDYAGVRKSSILDTDLLGELFTPKEYIDFARDCLFNKVDIGEMSVIQFE
jgi:REP element-mobilizing transposase RayT